MSTRANIVLKDEYDELIFYKHSDGYPEGVTPLINKFLGMVKSGEVRDNVVQAGGWLIELGRQDFLETFKGEIPNGYSWKIGSIEPTTEIHGDIEYKYTIDLSNLSVTTEAV